MKRTIWQFSTRTLGSTTASQTEHRLRLQSTRQRQASRRHGLASMDVALMAGTLVPFCILLYYLARTCYASLFDIQAITLGTPLM